MYMIITYSPENACVMMLIMLCILLFLTPFQVIEVVVICCVDEVEKWNNLDRF